MTEHLIVAILLVGCVSCVAIGGWLVLHPGAPAWSIVLGCVIAALGVWNAARVLFD